MNYLMIKKVLKKHNIRYRENVNLKHFNSMKIEAVSKIFIEVNNAEELSIFVQKMSENHIQFLVLGNGSNLIFVDKTIKLPIVKLCFNDDIFINNGFILVNGNIDNRKFSYTMKEKGIGNFSFLYCIPGSLAGSVYMNASCFNKCISDDLKYVEVMDKQGKIYWLSKNECDFGYRESIFKDKELIILRLIFSSKNLEKNMIKEEMKRMYNEKFITQPLDYPSAGSIFKNGDFKAFELIKNIFPLGLVKKGAKISRKHANFIINYNKANGKDVLFIIENIRRKVYDKYKILLNLEVELIRSSKVCGKPQEKRFKKY